MVSPGQLNVPAQGTRRGPNFARQLRNVADGRTEDRPKGMSTLLVVLLITSVSTVLAYVAAGFTFVIPIDPIIRVLFIALPLAFALERAGRTIEVAARGRIRIVATCLGLSVGSSTGAACGPDT
jgi:hypothetical protein